jgi:uncharacterized protein
MSYNWKTNTVRLSMSTKILTFLLLIFLSSFALGQDLFTLVRNGNLAEVKRCIKLNPDSVNATNADGNTLLLIACYKGKVDIVKYLLKKGANPNSTSGEGSPILAAVYKNDVEIAKLLLKRNVKLDAKGRDGNSAVHYAVLNHSVEMVELLLKKGIDLNIVNSDGQTALSLAKAEKQEVLIKLLEAEHPK